MPWFPMRTGARSIRALCTDFMRHPISVCSLSIVYLALGCTLALAQSASSGAFDKDVPMPTAIGQLGQQDATALNELTSHLKAVGASPWIGMTGTGQITNGTKDQTAYSATLSILGGSWFRLDGQTSSGLLSIRIAGTHGTIQEADGHQFPIPANTAETGIFQFPQLRLSNFLNTTESLIDRGLITIGGVSLHRVTLESPSVTRDSGNGAQDAIATDLYFDPTSHLLVKSANSIRLDGGHGNCFLRVVTYGDYRKVGDSLVPFSYTQTLDGQKQWTLQLTNVQLDPTLNPTFFEF